MAVDESLESSAADKSSLRGFLPLRHVEPEPLRWAFLGAGVAGLVGAIVGLTVGLFVFVPTAVFAMFEIGLPAALLGGVLGLLIYGLVAVARRISRSGCNA